MRCPEKPQEWGRDAGWALQLCPKSERLPQRWKPDSLQWLLIIQSQFVPSRRARSPAKPPLLAARSRQSIPGLVQGLIPFWKGFGRWDRLSCPIPSHYPIPERSHILGRVMGSHTHPLGDDALCSLVDPGKQPRAVHTAEGFPLGRLEISFSSPPSQPHASLAFPHGEAALKIFFLLHPAIPSQDKVHPKAFLTPGVWMRESKTPCKCSL